MARLKKAERDAIVQHFGKGPETSALMAILSILPKLLEKVLEVIRVWNEHKAKTKIEEAKTND